MLFSFNVFGETVHKTAIPLKKEHLKVRFYGRAELDNIHLQDILIDDLDILSITEEMDYIDSSIFIANFEDSLEAGTIDNQGLTITHWRIKRRKVGDPVFKLVEEIPYVEDMFFYIDYSNANKTNYEYAVYPVSNGTEGNPTGGVTMSEFWGWVLTDGETNYLFDVEIETENIKTMIGMKEYLNFTEFPGISFSNQKYDIGALTTMPFEFDGEYILNKEILDNIKSFINNKQTKYLKNSIGQVWEVVTHDFDYKFLDKFADQPYRISFKWIQVGEGEF